MTARRAMTVGQVAHGIAAGDDPLAVGRGPALALEDAVVGIVEPHGLQESHGVGEPEVQPL